MPLQPGLVADHKRNTRQEGRFIQGADDAIRSVGPEHRVFLGLHGMRLDQVTPGQYGKFALIFVGKLMKLGMMYINPLNLPRPLGHHMATGLTIICTVPLMRAWPSTNRNSRMPSLVSLQL